MLYRTTWERLKHLRMPFVDALSSTVVNGMTSIEALFESLTYKAIESEKCDDVVGLKASSRPKIFAWQIFARRSWRTIAVRTRRPCKSTIPSVIDTGLGGRLAWVTNLRVTANLKLHTYHALDPSTQT
jgi:hypothetical protein